MLIVIQRHVLDQRAGSLLARSRVQNEEAPSAYFDVEFLDGDGARLAHAVCPAHCLVLQGRVQGRLHEEDVVGGREVDAHRPAAHAQQEHRRGRILLEGLVGLQGHTTPICDAVASSARCNCTF